MESKLKRTGERARREPREKFTSIYHLVYDLENLRASFEAMKAGKSPGVDGVTKAEYGEDLEAKLEDLSGRLARMGYRPRPVRRHYIPKPGSDRKRPLGIPCLEDKLVQEALRRVLEPIYEADFLDCSFGYRPGRSQHSALDQLGRAIQRRRLNYVAEADIESFFDRVHHDWMVKFLEVRIGDQRVLRLIRRILKSGVMEDGLMRASEEGTPQGGVLSALLSNVYLHYVLDLWVQKRVRRQCRGEVYYVRYADDFVACFQLQAEAEEFLRQLEQRLAQFHLKLAASKTRLLAFGRFAERNAKREGRRVQTFDFLGFTHYCGRSRKGHFKVKRRTSAQKRRAKVREIKGWLQKQRSCVKTGQILRGMRAKLEGHLEYYAITDNTPSCDLFRTQVTELLFKWLNRRSQRRSYTWQRFNDALHWVGWPSVRVRHNLCPFRVGPE
jgi:group II intron reverse transcriptase/maturase